ncbi:MAG: phosphate/phosphite/phosphonate ABC transporter substrate-binding protein [Pirellulales bacterium]
MSDATSAPSASPQPSYSLSRILAIVLPIAAVGVIALVWSRTLESQARSDMASIVMGRMFLAEPMPTTGQMAFADADGDMLADPPSDPAKLLNPQVLVFSYVATEEAGTPDETWTELAAALKQKVGKDVKVVHYKNSEEQLAAIKKGELHIIGMNTGLVQKAVEEDGFVPVCTLGKADGSWGYTMEFLVPAGSPIKKLEDIKGHKVTFTTLDSNSGCKAPLVKLKEKCNLLPERDYQIGFSQGHEDSIKNIAAKVYEVAPIASDILARMEEKKEIDPTAVVSIYKSERFPPATIGYVYNLTPELRDGIRDTLLSFDWKGTGLEKTFGPEGKEKFVPVSYKDDWANTRRIDQVIADARRSSSPAQKTKSGP